VGKPLPATESYRKLKADRYASCKKSNKMKTRQILFSIILILSISQATILAQHTPIDRSIPAGVVVQRDIKYVSFQDRHLLLDVYRPDNSGEEKLPTILVIRGGGWASGDKEGFGPVAAALALRGFASVCIEYRASDEAIFPAAVLDTKSAVKWIKMNADKYNFDSSNIGVIGGSAGAHLAALLATSSSISFLNPSEDTNDFTVQAVVGMATPTDFEAMTEATAIIKWLGKPYANNEKLWQSASPITYIDKDSPPMLLIHGTSDIPVPIEQSLLAAEKLGKAGVYTELIFIPGAPHPFWNFKEWFDFTLDKAASFFQEQLIN